MHSVGILKSTKKVWLNMETCNKRNAFSDYSTRQNLDLCQSSNRKIRLPKKGQWSETKPCSIVIMTLLLTLFWKVVIHTRKHQKTTSINYGSSVWIFCDIYANKGPIKLLLNLLGKEICWISGMSSTLLSLCFPTDIYILHGNGNDNLSLGDPTTQIQLQTKWRCWVLPLQKKNP